jgi:hypothetical protein
MTVIVFPGKIFVGHLGLFVRPDGSGDFPINEDWRRDLIAPEEATRIALEGIRDGGAEGWPEGWRHVYVDANREGSTEINFYDCACEARGES